MKVIQCCNFHEVQQMAALLAVVAHELLSESGNQNAGGWVSAGQNAVRGKPPLSDTSNFINDVL